MAEQVEDGEDDAEQRQQEIESLMSIYGDEMKVLKAGREYLVSLCYRGRTRGCKIVTYTILSAGRSVCGGRWRDRAGIRAQWSASSAWARAQC